MTVKVTVTFARRVSNTIPWASQTEVRVNNKTNGRGAADNMSAPQSCAYAECACGNARASPAVATRGSSHPYVAPLRPPCGARGFKGDLKAH